MANRFLQFVLQFSNGAFKSRLRVYVFHSFSKTQLTLLQEKNHLDTIGLNWIYCKVKVAVHLTTAADGEINCPGDRNPARYAKNGSSWFILTIYSGSTTDTPRLRASCWAELVSWFLLLLAPTEEFTPTGAQYLNPPPPLAFLDFRPR